MSVLSQLETGADKSSSYSDTGEDIRFVSTPADGQCGVGMYTQQLVESFEEGSPSKTTFDPQSATLLTYLQVAITTAQADEDIVHVQFEYGLFCEAFCRRLNIPAIAAILFFALLRLLTLLRGKKVVTTMHTVYNVRDGNRPMYGILYLKFLHSLIVWATDTVVFLSTESKTSFEKGVSLENAVIFPHGAEMSVDISVIPTEAKKSFGYTENETIVALPGYIEHRKGHHRFLTVAEQLPDYEFLIAGGARTEQMKPFEEQIRRQKGPNVQVTGTLDEEAFQRAFVAADVVVLPYEEIDQSGILNWCAVYETPVVATKLPYFERLSEDWGSVETVDVDENCDQLTTVIERVLASESLRQELESGMRSYRNKNSFETVASKHGALYRSLLS